MNEGTKNLQRCTMYQTSHLSLMSYSYSIILSLVPPAAGSEMKDLSTST